MDIHYIFEIIGIISCYIIPIYCILKYDINYIMRVNNTSNMTIGEYINNNKILFIVAIIPIVNIFTLLILLINIILNITINIKLK